MARNLANEPAFSTSEIQGDILPGLPKNHEHLIFFHIQDVGKFKKFVKSLSLTSMQECLAKRAAIKVKKDGSSGVIYENELSWSPLMQGGHHGRG